MIPSKEKFHSSRCCFASLMRN